MRGFRENTVSQNKALEDILLYLEWRQIETNFFSALGHVIYWCLQILQTGPNFKHDEAKNYGLMLKVAVGGLSKAGLSLLFCHRFSVWPWAIYFGLNSQRIQWHKNVWSLWEWGTPNTRSYPQELIIIGFYLPVVCLSQEHWEIFLHFLWVHFKSDITNWVFLGII